MRKVVVEYFLYYGNKIFLVKLTLKKSQKDEILPILGKILFLKKSFTLKIKKSINR